MAASFWSSERIINSTCCKIPIQHPAQGNFAAIRLPTSTWHGATKPPRHKPPVPGNVAKATLRAAPAKSPRSMRLRPRPRLQLPLPASGLPAAKPLHRLHQHRAHLQASARLPRAEHHVSKPRAPAFRVALAICSLHHQRAAPVRTHSGKDSPHAAGLDSRRQKNHRSHCSPGQPPSSYPAHSLVPTTAKRASAHPHPINPASSEDTNNPDKKSGPLSCPNQNALHPTTHSLRADEKTFAVQCRLPS